MSETQLFTINKQHPLARGLVSCWHARASAHGLRWWDACGRNHGTLNGATWRGDRMEFDGADDFVDVGSDATVNQVGNVTVSAWYKANGNYTTQQGIIVNSLSSGGAGNYALTFAFTDNKFEFWNNVGGPDITSASSYSDNDWHHVVATRSGSSGSWALRIYLDGVLDQSAVVATNPDGGSYPTSIGRFGAFGGYYVNGSINDVRLYNRAISAAEIRSLYRDPLAIFNRLRVPSVKAPAAPAGNRRRRLIIGAAA